MSFKLSRRNVPSGSKMALLKSQPLPESPGSPDDTASTDSWDSCLTAGQSAASRGNKDDEFYWHHSTGESSLLGQSSSSFMSWADDMELGMTEKIQHLLDEVDRSLYGEGSAEGSLQPDQVQECEQWKEKFPHLRVVGRSLPTNDRVDDCDSVHVPAEVEEVIASHGCCEDGGSACCSRDRSDHSRQEEDALQKKIVQSVKDEVCAYVWSEVAKRLSEQTLQVSRLSPDACGFLGNRDSSTSAKQPSGRVCSLESLKRGERACSLPRRVPLGALRASEKSNRQSAHNFPLLAPQRDANSWKLLDRGRAQSSQQRPGRWSRHVTLPPIENMQLNAKQVTQCGRKSPAVFGEKMNNFSEHSCVNDTLLGEPKADWRCHETSGDVQAITVAFGNLWSKNAAAEQDGYQESGSSRNEVYDKYVGSDQKRVGCKNSIPCKKSTKCKRQRSQKNTLSQRTTR